LRSTDRTPPTVSGSATVSQPPTLTKRVSTVLPIWVATDELRDRFANDTVAMFAVHVQGRPFETRPGARTSRPSDLCCQVCVAGLSNDNMFSDAWQLADREADAAIGNVGDRHLILFPALAQQQCTGRRENARAHASARAAMAAVGRSGTPTIRQLNRNMSSMIDPFGNGGPRAWTQVDRRAWKGPGAKRECAAGCTPPPRASMRTSAGAVALGGG